MRLTTAALDPDRLAGLADRHKSPGRQRLDEQHPCDDLAGTCGRLPTRRYLRGWLCVEHAPPLPTTGYCAPGRCYCAGRCRNDDQAQASCWLWAA